MQTIIITGRIGKDSETREVRGQNVTNFNVGVRQYAKGSETTNWYRCAIWGERGVKLSHHLTKGAKVAVTGELEISEWEGKQQLNVRVADCDPFMGSGGGATSPGSTASHTGGGGPVNRPQPAAFAHDLDDDVPFATSSPEWEGRVS